MRESETLTLPITNKRILRSELHSTSPPNGGLFVPICISAAR